MTEQFILKTKSVCQVENCKRKYHAKGFCKIHYDQMSKWGETRPLKLHETQCTVKGCTRKHYAKGYCRRHRNQILKYGVISGNPKKLKYGEPNRYIFKGDVCEIELYNTGGYVKAHAVIDTEDYSKVKNIKWSVGGRGYVTNGRRNGIHFKLHRVVLGLSVNDNNPDHIDGDSLNNKKLNLRICTQHQNTCNNKKPKNNTSGYKGVFWDKSRNKWIAQIKFNYKSIRLGQFENKIDAAKAYNEGSIKYFGEFARLNHLQVHPNTVRV